LTQKSLKEHVMVGSCIKSLDLIYRQYDVTSTLLLRITPKTRSGFVHILAIFLTLTRLQGCLTSIIKLWSGLQLS
jgi:hypothetical protein